MLLRVPMKEIHYQVIIILIKESGIQEISVDELETKARAKGRISFCENDLLVAAIDHNFLSSHQEFQAHLKARASCFFIRFQITGCCYDSYKNWQIILAINKTDRIIFQNIFYCQSLHSLFSRQAVGVEKGRQ